MADCSYVDKSEAKNTNDTDAVARVRERCPFKKKDEIYNPPIAKAATNPHHYIDFRSREPMYLQVHTVSMDL